MFSTGALVALSRRLPRPREYSAFARLARCVCLTRGDCRDLGNAQHSLGWRVAYYVQAVLRTKPSPRDFVTRSWARSHFAAFCKHACSSGSMLTLPARKKSSRTLRARAVSFITLCKLSLCNFNQCGETFRIVDSHLGKHLSVNLNLC